METRLPRRPEASPDQTTHHPTTPDNPDPTTHHPTTHHPTTPDNPEHLDSPSLLHPRKDSSGSPGRTARRDSPAFPANPRARRSPEMISPTSSVLRRKVRQPPANRVEGSSNRSPVSPDPKASPARSDRPPEPPAAHRPSTGTSSSAVARQTTTVRISRDSPGFQDRRRDSSESPDRISRRGNQAFPANHRARRSQETTSRDSSVLSRSIRPEPPVSQVSPASPVAGSSNRSPVSPEPKENPARSDRPPVNPAAHQQSTATSSSERTDAHPAMSSDPHPANPVDRSPHQMGSSGPAPPASPVSPENLDSQLPSTAPRLRLSWASTPSTRTLGRGGPKGFFVDAEGGEPGAPGAPPDSVTRERMFEEPEEEPVSSFLAPIEEPEAEDPSTFLDPKDKDEQDPSTFLAPIQEPDETMKSFLNPNAAPEGDEEEAPTGEADEIDAG